MALSEWYKQLYGPKTISYNPAQVQFEFPSLIGSIEIDVLAFMRPKKLLFPSLIGSIEIFSRSELACRCGWFPSLIGSIEMPAGLGNGFVY